MASFRRINFLSIIIKIGKWTQIIIIFLKNSTHFGNLEELMSKEQRGKEHETN
jgi:hypothetical protein